VKLEFHPEAELELIEAAEYYELEVPGLGKRFEAEVRRATDFLLDHPEIGIPVDPVLRKLTLNRFPFALYYSAAWNPIFCALRLSHTKVAVRAIGGRGLTRPLRNFNIARVRGDLPVASLFADGRQCKAHGHPCGGARQGSLTSSA
jgi:plasmid stabilization system protein ParE